VIVAVERDIVEAPASASVKASPLIRNMAAFGLIGFASGILVWLVISFVWESLIGLDAHAVIAGWDLSFGNLTLVPGFVFGNAVGLALVRFGLTSPGRAMAYIAAATVSNFIATNFAANMIDAIDSAAFLGMAAGLIGAVCLTGLSLLLLPFARQILPCLSMVAAGAALPMASPRTAPASSSRSTTQTNSSGSTSKRWARTSGRPRGSRRIPWSPLMAQPT
jgi:hypothetical protein